MSDLQLANNRILFLSYNSRTITNVLTLVKVFENTSEFHTNLAKSWLVGMNLADDMVKDCVQRI